MQCVFSVLQHIAVRCSVIRVLVMLLVPRIQNFVLRMISLCYFQKKIIWCKSVVCLLPLHRALVPLKIRSSFQHSIFISLYMYVYMYMYILYKVNLKVNPGRKAHDTLQHTATRCNTLHHTAPYFNTLQRTLQQTLT